jgi:protease-4
MMSGTRKAILIIAGILGAVVLVVLIGVALIWSAFRKSSRQSATTACLRFASPAHCQTTVPDDPFKKYFGGPDQSLTGLVMQFKKAKVDKRIKAILLDVNMSGVGWGKAEEIRDAITDFRSSGKPVYAYIEFGLNKEYYIATACDKIIVPPPGELFINGLAADVMFFRGSLDKLGIYPDIYQIGKYKSAGDMFTQKEMTDAHREYINEMLDDLYGRYVNAIAQARHKTPEEVRALIDNAPYNAVKAKEAGLIDEMLYRDDVEKEFKKLLGYKETDQFVAVRGSDYRDVSPESLGLNKGERIAVIYASGDIGSGSSANSPSGDQSIGSDTVAKALNDAAADKTTQGDRVACR